jgi:hypothetical protein
MTVFFFLCLNSLPVLGGKAFPGCQIKFVDEIYKVETSEPIVDLTGTGTALPYVKYGVRSPKFIWASCAQLYSLA